MKTPTYSYEKAKHLVVNNIGNEIMFSSKISRGKTYKDKGVVTAAYKNIFTIAINKNGKDETISYSYNDIINNNLTIYENKQNEFV